MRSEALDDFSGEGCPFCRAAARVEHAWLRGLLDEVGDAKVRSALERGGGLCSAHVLSLVDVAVGSGKLLGLGAVLEVLLTQAGRELDARRVPRRARKGRGVTWPRRPRPSAHTPSGVGCGACGVVRLRENAYAELLLAAGDTALQRRARDPRRALCRPHLSGVRDAAAALGSAPGGAGGAEEAARERVGDLLGAVRRSIGAHRVGSEVLPGVHEAVLREVPKWLAGEGGIARIWAPGVTGPAFPLRGSRS
ncbi:MAG TPA: hypothetical protein VMD28_08770 [Acidimicrobiales bacterium]|nr:hypothetical protein [Acidimicrobiales bacterium]